MITKYKYNIDCEIFYKMYVTFRSIPIISYKMLEREPKTF
jgi:hypothetical protein